MSARNGVLYREVTVGFQDDDTPIKERIGFSFTMNFWNEFCRREGVKMSELGKVFYAENPRIFEVYQNVLYCAGLAYAEVRNKDFPFNRAMAGEWLTEMEQGDFNELIQEMTETRIFGKNLNGSKVMSKNEAA